MGKSGDKFSNRIRFGELSKEERKVIEKTPSRDVMAASFENTHICNDEIGAMLTCFKDNEWSTTACIPQIEVRGACPRGVGTLLARARSHGSSPPKTPPPRVSLSANVLDRKCTRASTCTSLTRTPKCSRRSGRWG